MTDTWEPLNGRKPRAGDELRQEFDDTPRTGTVAYLDSEGDPWTAEGVLIGVLDLGTWYVRRSAQYGDDA